ncbi:unnamed protein product, partial [Polarella glacialis]
AALLPYISWTAEDSWAVPVRGVLAGVPQIKKLGYCPPIDLALTHDLSCAAKNVEGAGPMNTFVIAQVEHTEWAVAEAREHGKLSSGDAAEILAFLEAYYLVFCILRYACVLNGQNVIWEIGERCETLYELIPSKLRGDLFPLMEDCVETGSIINTLGFIRVYVHNSLVNSSNHDDQGFAWYPKEVSPSCGNMTGRLPLRGMHAFMFTNTADASYTINSDTWLCLGLVFLLLFVLLFIVLRNSVHFCLAVASNME